MKFRIGITEKTWLYAVLTACIVTASLSQEIAKQKPIPTSLKWYAELAKEKGLTAITTARTETYDYTQPLSAIVKSSLPIKGVVIDTVSDTTDGFKIYQWYVIRIVDRGSEPHYREKVIHSDIPQRLRVMHAGQLLVRAEGGTTVVDNVSVTQPGISPLKIGNEYLFMLAPTDDQFYRIAANTHPISIDSNGRIDVANDSSQTRFTREMRDVHTFSELERIAEQKK